jgi:hypothetical protein
MPGTSTSNEVRSDEQIVASEPFDLETVLSVGRPVPLPIIEGNFDPVPVIYDGVTITVKREFTGKQVIAAARLLVVPDLPGPKALTDPKLRDKLSTEERIALSDKHVQDYVDHFNAHVVKQLGSVIGSGNAHEFWLAIKDLPKSLADRMISALYKIAGLANAEGEFLAL